PGSTGRPRRAPVQPAIQKCAGGTSYYVSSTFSRPAGMDNSVAFQDQTLSYSTARKLPLSISRMYQIASFPLLLHPKSCVSMWQSNLCTNMHYSSRRRWSPTYFLYLGTLRRKGRSRRQKSEG